MIYTKTIFLESGNLIYQCPVLDFSRTWRSIPRKASDEPWCSPCHSAWRGEVPNTLRRHLDPPVLCKCFPLLRGHFFPGSSHLQTSRNFLTATDQARSQLPPLSAMGSLSSTSWANRDRTKWLRSIWEDIFKSDARCSSLSRTVLSWPLLTWVRILLFVYTAKESSIYGDAHEHMS